MASPRFRPAVITCRAPPTASAVHWCLTVDRARPDPPSHPISFKSRPLPGVELNRPGAGAESRGAAARSPAHQSPADGAPEPAGRAAHTDSLQT